MGTQESLAMSLNVEITCQSTVILMHFVIDITSKNITTLQQKLTIKEVSCGHRGRVK